MNSINAPNPINATLYLLRHGATALSSEKRYIGQTDVALSDLGRKQAHWWQKELSRIQFDAVYSSDLTRALQTARVVAGRQAKAIQVTQTLREINLGDWDGAGMRAIQDNYPVAWEKRGQQMDCFRPPNGESFQDLQARVMPVVESIDFTHARNVLMVTHAGVNRVLLCHMLNKPLKDLFQIPQGEAALNQIGIRDGKYKVLAVNRLPP